MYIKPNPRPVIRLYPPINQGRLKEKLASTRPPLASREPVMDTTRAPYLVMRQAASGPVKKEMAI
jgi:hypothetical protein